MLQLIKSFFKNIARSVGVDVRAFDFRRIHELRKWKLIHELGINLVIDGGANEGQFVQRVRKAGYTGRMVSIEPLPDVFSTLLKNMGGIQGWKGLACGLGAENCQMSIHVANDPQSSSLLTATGIADTGNWIGRHNRIVSIRRLDGILDEFANEEDRIYLKLDVQGYEDKALAGLGVWFDRLALIELEASTVELYQGETLFHDLARGLALRQFTLFSFDEILVDHRTG